MTDETEHGVDLSKLRQLRAHDLIIRFLAGATTSLIAGLIGLANARIGGLFLAFPAILIAGLTLVEQKEGRKAAHDTARGSIAGGIGLTAFALTALTTLRHLPAAAALTLATIAWAITSLTTYLLIHSLSRAKRA